MNQLLDRVESDRARIHYLAGRSVRARDIERESVAHELRDSLAQSLAGAALKVAAARGANQDPRVDEYLWDIREALQQVTDDMRSIAETLYPGTLQEFGLTNALAGLARRVSRRSKTTVEVDAGLFKAPLSARAASALYRVADEALRNVEQHANAAHARVTLRSNGDVSLEIEDDGRGIEMRTQDPLQAGLGLFSAKTVLALVGGELQISSAPDRGTRVVAHVPAGGTS
jgi:signal transduction histidine kinase